MNTPSIPWQRHPALLQARRRSLELLEQLRQELNPLADAVHTIAVTGSLARLDAVDASDVDLIVVLRDGDGDDPRRAENLMGEIDATLKGHGLSGATAGGIYRQPTTIAELTRPESRGVVNEAMHVFGQRMQLLIESRPVCNHEAYRSTLDAALHWYCPPWQPGSGIHPTDYLRHDLIRYHHAYRIAKLWAFQSDRDGWALKQIKVRHSRLVTFASILFSLADPADTPTQRHERLATAIQVSPLERLANLFHRFDVDLSPLLDAYDFFVAAMADRTTRHVLNDATSPTHQADGQTYPPVYGRLLDNARRITEDLTKLASAIVHQSTSITFDQFLL